MWKRSSSRPLPDPIAAAKRHRPHPDWEDADAESLFNLIHVEAVAKVDFIVRNDDRYQREESPTPRRAAWRTPAVVVSAEDLILSKLVWAKPSRSELQLRDVRHLLTAIGSLDHPYLDRWAASLMVTDLLHEARA